MAEVTIRKRLLCCLLSLMTFLALRCSASPLSPRRAQSRPEKSRFECATAPILNDTINDVAVIHRDCLRAASRISRHGNITNPDPAIEWYPASDKHTTPAAFTVPQRWSDGRCYVTLAWRDSDHPPRLPVYLDPRTISHVAAQVIQICVRGERRPWGLTAFGYSASELTISFQGLADPQYFQVKAALAWERRDATELSQAIDWLLYRGSGPWP